MVGCVFFILIIQPGWHWEQRMMKQYEFRGHFISNDVHDEHPKNTYDSQECLVCYICSISISLYKQTIAESSLVSNCRFIYQLLQTRSTTWSLKERRPLSVYPLTGARCVPAFCFMLQPLLTIPTLQPSFRNRFWNLPQATSTWENETSWLIV